MPQNTEYVKTYELVKEIAKCAGHKIWITKLLNPCVWIAEKMPGKLSEMINKVFGNLIYEKKMSDYYEGKYRIRNMKQSIEVTEKLR